MTTPPLPEPFTTLPANGSATVSISVWASDAMEAYAAACVAAARVPLTDEQIRDLWSWSAGRDAERTARTQQHAFARAIERAHGIGEKA